VDTWGRLVQEVGLEAGGRVLEFDTTVEWHENRKILKVKRMGTSGCRVLRQYGGDAFGVCRWSFRGCCVAGRRRTKASSAW
jgi:hypothetical protein